MKSNDKLIVVLNQLLVGQRLPEMVTIDQANELDAIHVSKTAIHSAQEKDDQITADLLRKILMMEEGQADWADQQSDQNEQMWRGNYLANQTTGTFG